MKKNHLCFLALSILIMIVIFCFSCRNGSQSQVQSDRFVFILPFISYDLSSFLIRKAAHFLVYFALGFCLLGSFSKGAIQKNQWIALLIASVYAASDEIHQLFVPGRAGMIEDVFLDTFAAWCGIFVYTRIGRWISRPFHRTRKHL